MAWIDPPYRTCKFCGCVTNAHARACCEKGREADSKYKEYQQPDVNDIRDVRDTFGGETDC